MKIAFACLLVLIASVMGGMVASVSEKTECTGALPLLSTLNAPTSGVSSAPETFFVVTNPGENSPQAPRGTDQIQQTADFVMNASAIPAMGAILCVIAVLCSPAMKLHGSLVRPSRQGSLLRILFQTIVAPNAP